MKNDKLEKEFPKVYHFLINRLQKRRKIVYNKENCIKRT